MWTCKKCEKPVYFAERIQSLGFDWHPSCLVCKECGKKLHPGQHAEHAAEPYCHHPCYGALFGPRLFGHGTRNECHGAFGKINKPRDAERAALEAKVKEFNQYFDGKPGQISCREANGRVVLEGMLRVHWSVHCLIHLKQEDDVTQTSAIHNNSSGPPSDDSDDEPLWRDDTPPSTPSTPTPSTPASSSSCSTPNPNWPPTPYPTIHPSSSNSSISSLQQDGPQASPVLSYTHNAPPHAPISQPANTLLAVEASDHPEDSDLVSWEGSEDLNGTSETCYATMKLRTVRRRKDYKNVTQSLTEMAMRACDDSYNDTEEEQKQLLDNNKNVTSVQEENLQNKVKSGVVKRVSFSQVDWNEKLKPKNDANGNDNDEKPIDPGDGKRTPVSKGRAILRRRPGRRMDKKKVKRRCSINGHLYLRETSSFHLDSNCPPAVVRVTSLTSTDQLIATILEKYKIEMSASNFALYVCKDNGEQRKLTSTESPLTTRVMLGPHDSVAKLVLCDDNTTSEITPEVAQFVHLSLAECRAILRQYELEELKEIRSIRAKYDEIKFYCQYWLEQMDKDTNTSLITGL